MKSQIQPSAIEMIERTFYLNFTKPLLLKEFCAEKEPTKLKKYKKIEYSVLL